MTTVVSYSELDTYRQCPLKHAIAYRLRYSKPSEENSPLAKGSLWHLVMETHYRTLQDIQTILEENTGSWVIPPDERQAALASCRAEVNPLFQDTETGQQTETQELIQWMYEGYVSLHGVDHDWKILDIELPIRMPLLDKTGNPSGFEIKGRIDLVVWDQVLGANVVVDHKSGSELPKWAELALEDQFGLYIWMLKRQGLAVQTAIYNAARTRRTIKPQPAQERFSRTRMYYSNTELTNIALDAYLTASSAYSEQNTLPYSAPNPRQCGWRCQFMEPHLVARKGDNIEEVLRNFGFTQDFTRH